MGRPLIRVARQAGPATEESVQVRRTESWPRLWVRAAHPVGVRPIEQFQVGLYPIEKQKERMETGYALCFALSLLC